MLLKSLVYFALATCLSTGAIGAPLPDTRPSVTQLEQTSILGAEERGLLEWPLDASANRRAPTGESNGERVGRGLPPAKPRKLYSRDKPAKELEARVVGAPANAFPSPATARVKAYQHCVPSRVQNDASPNDGGTLVSYDAPDLQTAANTCATYAANSQNFMLVKQTTFAAGSNTYQCVYNAYTVYGSGIACSTTNWAVYF